MPYEQALYVPQVNVAKELAEISKDFTNPRELVRETIANSIDASAGKIVIEAFKNDSSGSPAPAVPTNGGVFRPAGPSRHRSRRQPSSARLS